MSSVAHWADPTFLLGGKTIVGGLIGGLIAVEWIKRRLGVVVATGDLLVLPLMLGIAIGRIGCFLSGLADRTYGSRHRACRGAWTSVTASLRHPTQLYEIAFLAALARACSSRSPAACQWPAIGSSCSCWRI